MGILADLIQFRVSGTTGALTVTGAVSPFMTPAQYNTNMGGTTLFNSGTCSPYYSIIDQSTGNSETGLAVYTASSTSFTRTVTTSTNSGSPISVTANAFVSFTGISSALVNKSGDTMTGTLALPGTSSLLATLLTNATEIATVSATAATGTIEFYPSTQSVLYYTSNASANWTVDFKFSSGTALDTALSTGQSLTVAFLVTQGSTAYYNNAITIDGNATGAGGYTFTNQWVGGAPTSGNISGVDVYTYTLIKTATKTFSIFATQTQFKA